MSRKQPIRTYQRKTARKPLISISAAPSVILTEKYNPVSRRGIFDESRTCSISINDDPFETTFDKIAKEAVIPPLPLDTYQNDSWNTSSSNGDISSSATGFIKPIGHIASISFTRDNGPSSISDNVRPIRKCRGQQKRKLEVTVSKGILSKSIRVPRNQKDKVQRKRLKQHKFKKSNRMCNEQVSHACSDTINDPRDATRVADISCNYNGKHPYENLKIDKNTDITMLTAPIETTESIGASECMSGRYQSIKASSVYLDANAVDDWYVMRRKTGATVANTLRDVNLPDIDIQHTSKDISGLRNDMLLPIEFNDTVRASKHTPIKSCFVILPDRIMTDQYVPRNENGMNSSIEGAQAKLNVSRIVFCNLSDTTPDCNSNINIAISKTNENKENVIKRSFVKMERWEVEKFTKKEGTALSGKQGYMISSTPVGRRVRSPVYPLLLSPIVNHDVLESRPQSSTIIVKKNTENVISPEKPREDRNHSLLSIIPSLELSSKRSKFDAAGMQEQQTQNLTPSQELQISVAFKTEAVSSNDDIRVALTCRAGFPHFLGVSAVCDQSRSLFDDTTCSRNGLAESIVKNNVEEKSCMRILNTEPIKPEMTVSLRLSADLNSKEKKQLFNNSVCTYVKSECVPVSKMCAFMKRKESECLDNICIKKTYEDTKKGNETIDKDTTEELCEKFSIKNTNDGKHSFCEEGQEDDSNAVDVCSLLTQLQDPARITKRRVQYPQCRSLSNISEALDNITQSNNKISNYVPIGEHFDKLRSMANNFEHSKDTINSPLEHSKMPNDSIQRFNDDDINMHIERSIFLKPGKYWARSLSMLNNINDEFDLERLSIGKGKRWRHSVKNILDMQKQGVLQSCLKRDKNDKDFYRSCETLDVHDVRTSFDANGSKVLSSGKCTRFSKRISVRVVPNSTSVSCNTEDAPFLEAFGISTESSTGFKLLHQKESPISDIEYYVNGTVESNLKTAKDVVLQKCSQEYYLHFSQYFPDSYLEHCRKIGEGVYGEVFLYEYENERSVIKIIPVEGEQLVNGEPQKKFSEILSEIVIAKELHNLSLNATYKTDGFVEVKGIKCIIGRYPEKLVAYWNIYDDDKTSDNDCPSMFGENQLYIVLELDHGGEDLEAFVFQTAREACALFLQIALSLAVAEKALEFEHRDLHWGNILISRTKKPYVHYNLGGKELRLPSNGVKVSIIDFTLSRILYKECCIYNDLALDPALFTAYGEYQFEIYRLMRDKIQNNWRKFEPYTNVLWLHYTLDKMITAVRYKRKNLKVHQHAVTKLKELKGIILNYDSAFDFVSNCDNVARLQSELG